MCTGASDSTAAQRIWGCRPYFSKTVDVSGVSVLKRVTVVSLCMGATVTAVLPGCGSGRAGAELTCRPPQSPPSLIRRLNRREYDNTVKALLGVSTSWADRLPPDELDLGFDTVARVQGPSSSFVERVVDNADRLASTVEVATLLPCRPARGGESACADAFIHDFGRRAYRRPLENAEADILRRVYESARREGLSFEEGLRRILRVMLSSPQFLYRPETGVPSPGQSAAPLTSYEVASRLSYFLWSSMPDDALLEAAEANALETPDAIESQARRMMKDPRARATIAAFHAQWLRLARLDRIFKDPAAHPDFDSLRPFFKEETQRFLEHVFWEEGRTESLFLSRTAFWNDALAQFYGGPALEGGEFQRVQTDGLPRRGLLTQASLLAVYAQPDRTSPTRRGDFVRRRLLCQELPPPPNNVGMLPDVGEARTMRDRMEQHRVDPACNGCHSMLDPVGFGFEAFDAMGAWRVEDNGVAVDDSGDLLGAGEVTGPFRGAEALSEKLANSRMVRRCVTLQWFRFAQGREEEEGDECALEQVRERFEASGYDLRELVVGIVRSDAFRSRDAAWGVSP
jgi:hypothetical protein